MGDLYAGAGIEERPRVAVLAGDEHGAMLEQLLELGVPGHDVDVITAAPPSPSDYALIHDLTARCAGWRRAARAAGVPVIASFGAAHDYDGCELVLSPSGAADQSLREYGVEPARIARLPRAVDVRRYHPARFTPDARPSRDAFHVLHVGGRELDLALDAIAVAHDHNPRLRLVLAGGDPPARLATHTSHVSRLTPELYASCDLMLATATDDLAGEGILEAQASGLPVLAVNAGAAPELIANGRSGCLIAPDPIAIAAAVYGLARRAAVLERLATGGLLAIRALTWEAALAQLADAYALVLNAGLPEVARAA